MCGAGGQRGRPAGRVLRLSLSEVLLGTIRPKTRFWRGQLLALICVAIPTLIKIGLSPILPDRGQVVFYFPAVIVAAIWGGARAGVAALVLSSLIAWYAFTPPYFTLQLPPRAFAFLLAGFLLSGGLVVLAGAMLRSALLSSRRTEARYKALVDAATTVTFRMGRDGQFRESTEAWSDYTGLDWRQQRDGRWRDLIHADDRERVLARLGEAVAQRKACRIELRHWHAPSGAWRWVAWQIAPILDDDGALAEWMGAFIDIHEQRIARELEGDLLHELQHRVKNSLAVVRALCDQTARHSTSLGGFVATFNGRLNALSEAQGLLTDNSWGLASIDEVARTVLRAFMDEDVDDIVIDGPPVALKPITTTNLALAFHELATNASKYGALAAPEGRVDVSWVVVNGRVVLDWIESGGRKVRAPTRNGFGSRLLGRAFAHEPEASTKLEFAPEGVRYRATWRVAAESQSPPAAAREPLTTSAA
jgi:two-component system CheB/CheR fusion protein